MEPVKGTVCQLQVVYESGRPLTAADRLRTFALRINRAIKRRLERYLNFSNSEELADQAAHAINRTANRLFSLPGGECFQPGDTVEVLSMDEIRQTLDGNGRCLGLQFMNGMERFAGQRYRVLKAVNTIFDERSWKMVSVRNTVLLDGVVCDGRDQYDKEGCDRCCYYFWKTRWLRKVE